MPECSDALEHYSGLECSDWLDLSGWLAQETRDDLECYYGLYFPGQTNVTDWCGNENIPLSKPL